MPSAIVATVPSDSHAWNLVYLDLLLRESGFDVRNLGPCTPVAEIVRSARRRAPRLVVISSVNGHSRTEAPAIARALRRNPSLCTVPLVIGGMLATCATTRERAAAELRAIGFDAVFDGPGSVPEFVDYVARFTVPCHVA